MATPNQRRRRSAALWAAGVLLVAGVAAGVGWYFVNKGTGAGGPTAGGAEVAASTQPALLPTGHDYYVLVKLVELAPERPGGGKWDRAGYAAPDITYNLIWQKQTVFSSSVREDTLIGSWDLMAVDLKQVIASGGKVEAEGLLKAPIIRVDPGTVVTLEVWDKDPMNSDLAGRIKLHLDEMRAGDNVIRPEQTKKCAVVRAVVQLIDRSTPVPELLETLSKR